MLFSPIALYVLVAIGLNIVVGYAGLLDLGYVAFFAIGAYTIGVLTSAHGSLGFWAALPFAIARGDARRPAPRHTDAAPSWRLPRNRHPRVRGDHPHHREQQRVARRPARHHRTSLGPPTSGRCTSRASNAKPYYYLGLTFIILVILMVRALEHSRVGRAWTAIREDEDAAELMGVPTFKFKLWAFAMGAAIGGLSGALFASYQTVITPNNFTLQFSILFLAAVVLGGAGNIPGVILGAFLVAYLPERFRGLGSTRVFWYGVALVADDDLPAAGHLPEPAPGRRARRPRIR